MFKSTHSSQTKTISLVFKFAMYYKRLRPGSS